MMVNVVSSWSRCRVGDLANQPDLKKMRTWRREREAAGSRLRPAVACFCVTTFMSAEDSESTTFMELLAQSSFRHYPRPLVVTWHTSAFRTFMGRKRLS